MAVKLRVVRAAATGLCLAACWAGTASASVQVGVADTGVGSNLGGQVAPGWNFLTNTSDTSDPVWHGTFVAGLVQAEAQADATIVPLRVCNLANVSASVPPANCTAAALTSAVNYAGSHGIPIVNVSNNLTTGPTSLQAAIQNNPNVLVVTAAGNGSADIDSKPQYPCSFKLPNVICVTASTTNDALWSKADYGQTVELAAPGVNIQGKTPWTTQSYPADLSAGSNCEVQFKLKGSASPLTITATNGTITDTVAQWSGSTSTLKTATWPFPADLQGKTNVTVSFTGASGLTIQNLIAQCQGPTTQPFTSSGGSFATATVSGAAAVLEDQFPQATTAQIAAAILNGAKTDVTPAGKIQGNRELDLNGAIQQLTPKTGGPVQVGVADTGLAPNLGGQVAPGWNFVDSSPDTSDPVWHGTFAAGLVRAEAQADATIVPLRICDLANVSSSVPPATCTQAALAAAINYAAAHGIPVVSDSANFSTAGKGTTLKTAIQSHPNVLVVATAGDGSASVDSKAQYPCSFKLPNVICVTATGPSDVLWSKADYGQTVELAAPGVNIQGTTPWTTQSYPADLSAGSNCEVQFKLKGSASPLTITATNGTITDTVAQWTGSSSSLTTATWPFPADLQGKTNVTVSFTGASGLTIQNLIAQCQGPTTQPFTSNGGALAAATVSGAAAVLEDQFPQATTAQIVAAILNGAKTDVTPAGKIQGNRELNLNGAIQQLTSTG